MTSQLEESVLHGNKYRVCLGVGSKLRRGLVAVIVVLECVC